MKIPIVALLMPAVLTALLVTTADRAQAAPAGSKSVQDTIEQLESTGYKVILNRVGSARLDQCTVGAVRPGRDVTELRQNARDQTVERVLYTTVYVDAVC